MVYIYHLFLLHLLMLLYSYLLFYITLYIYIYCYIYIYIIYLLHIYCTYSKERLCSKECLPQMSAPLFFQKGLSFEK